MRAAPVVVGAVVAALAAGGCRSVVVTPDAVRAADAPAADRARALGNWHAAVWLANQFLASPFRRTLPPGRIVLDAGGMLFETPAGAWPLEVRCTTWGDVVLWSGGRAQEAAYGFAVAKRGPAGRDLDPALDNAFFRLGDGSLDDPSGLARLLLHELTHVVFADGTVGFFPSVAYYLELVFLLRSSTHSCEDRPRAATEEFLWFYFSTFAPDPVQRAISRRLFDEHLATGGDHCLHGPFAGWPEAPLPVGTARE